MSMPAPNEDEEAAIIWSKLGHNARLYMLALGTDSGEEWEDICAFCAWQEVAPLGLVKRPGLAIRTKLGEQVAAYGRTQEPTP